jgi:hypothetical protein
LTLGLQRATNVGMKLLPMLVLGFWAAAIPASAADYTLHTFKKLHLEKYYWSEGANFGDLNRDGRPDAISGPYWWESPDFTKRHEIYPPTTTFQVEKRRRHRSDTSRF